SFDSVTPFGGCQGYPFHWRFFLQISKQRLPFGLFDDRFSQQVNSVNIQFIQIIDELARFLSIRQLEFRFFLDRVASCLRSKNRTAGRGLDKWIAAQRQSETQRQVHIFTYTDNQCLLARGFDLFCSGFSPSADFILLLAADAETACIRDVMLSSL